MQLEANTGFGLKAEFYMTSASDPLPGGVSFDSATGTITGVPENTQPFARDSAGKPTPQTFSVAVSARPVDSRTNRPYFKGDTKYDIETAAFELEASAAEAMKRLPARGICSRTLDGLCFAPPVDGTKRSTSELPVQQPVAPCALLSASADVRGSDDVTAFAGLPGN